jgi:GxxExxY protein
MELKEKSNALSNEIIGAAIEVHKFLGPGLLESSYHASLCHELKIRNIPHSSEVFLPLEYKQLRLDAGYRIDLLVDGLVIVEIKSVSALAKIHEAQLLTYLRLTGIWLGLLINFNVPVLKYGIRRVVSGWNENAEKNILCALCGFVALW